MSILEKINSPEDLKNVKNLNHLALEIRSKIIELTNKNGGHLASNLGVVELTIALLKVYGSKDNAIIWDVGHQCYAYKMLTGRYKEINSIRTNGGVSGFTNIDESFYDHFTVGHASTSISLALGLCETNFFSGKKIAVIGDGAMTGGLAYEGLSNSAKFGKNLLVVLNDNNMSISKNVGFISKYLTKLRTIQPYLSTKQNVVKLLDKLPLGYKFKKILAEFKKILKISVMKESTIFEDMGFSYYGHVDGHNIVDLIKIFKISKNIEKPVLIHVVTKKGKGYRIAEKKPCIFHGINKVSLKNDNNNENFSEIFGKIICDLAIENKKIYVITAAMTSCLGLVKYSKKFPERFADVGIAESHAVTFAGGLSKGNMLPFFCVYSTFLQRTIDQIIHDVLMQRLKVIFVIDRAGFVGSDGESHQGIFDIAFLSILKGIRIYSPSFYNEISPMLSLMINEKSSCAIRYPKGSQYYKPDWQKYENDDFEIYKNNNGLIMKLVYTKNYLDFNNEILIIVYGRIFSFASKVLEELENKIILVKLNVLNEINEEIINFSLNFKKILFFEEHSKSCGVGEKFASMLMYLKYDGDFFIKAIDNNFVKHAEVDEQLRMFSLDYEGIKKEVLKNL